jgi:membrane protease YdiL (CAAX protease family)
MSQDQSTSLKSILGSQLRTNRWYKLGEILFLFISAFSIILLMAPFVDGNPIFKQAIVWIANVVMLIIVWAGIKLRGESWEDFGLTFKSISIRESIKVFLLSLLVLIIAMTGFILGSIIMANITGIPEASDMSGYDYLQNNIGMLLLTLGGVYIVSSFGEEVIYRAFLINRISQFGLDAKTGRIIAVILSSIIFGLIHYEWGPMGMVQTGFMGLALGICYIKLRKRLWILILAHAYMDTTLMIQMYLAN